MLPNFYFFTIKSNIKSLIQNLVFIGLPICVVATKTDLFDELERSENFKDEQFSYKTFKKNFGQKSKFSKLPPGMALENFIILPENVLARQCFIQLLNSNVFVHPVPPAKRVPISGSWPLLHLLQKRPKRRRPLPRNPLQHRVQRKKVHRERHRPIKHQRSAWVGQPQKNRAVTRKSFELGHRGRVDQCYS